MVIRTTLVRKGGAQVVRLPRRIAFPEGVRDVVILRDGVRRTIVPADQAWDDFFDAPGIDLPDRARQ